MQAMGAMNKQMNMPALMNIMREFERQNEKMEMTSDMMGDAIDDAFEVPHAAAQAMSCVGKLASFYQKAALCANARPDAS